MDKAKKNKKIKTGLKIAILVIVTLLSVFYLLHDDPAHTFALMGEVSLFPFLLSFLIVLFLPFLDALPLTLFARLYHKKYKFSQGLVNTLIGNFIGCVYKTGSMFLQAYTFSKQEVKGAHAASILTMQFLMYQFSFTLISLVMVFVGYPYVDEIPITLLGGIRIFPLSLIGLGVSILILLLILFLGYSKRFHHFIMNSGIDFLAKIHLLKHPEETRKKWTVQLVTYRIEIKRLSHHIFLVLISFLCTSVKLLLSYALPYLLFWAMKLDLSSLNFLSLFSGSSYLTLITSFLVVGAPEIGFQSIFGYLLSSASILDSFNYAAACNLLWRFLTFYFPLVFGMLFYIFYRGKPKKSVLLDGAATLYDYQVLNIVETKDVETAEFLMPLPQQGKESSSTLTMEDVEKSFLRLREKMKSETLEEEKVAEIGLEEQKKKLAEVVAETERLIEESHDSEIEAEVSRNLEESRILSAKKEEKRKSRKAKKEAKRRLRLLKKAERKLARKQSRGTKISFDEESGIHIEGNDFDEERTFVTSDQEEEKEEEK